MWHHTIASAQIECATTGSSELACATRALPYLTSGAGGPPQRESRAELGANGCGDSRFRSAASQRGAGGGSWDAAWVLEPRAPGAGASDLSSKTLAPFFPLSEC